MELLHRMVDTQHDTIDVAFSQVAGLRHYDEVRLDCFHENTEGIGVKLAVLLSRIPNNKGAAKDQISLHEGILGASR
jgi:hypothetical protein